MNSAKVARREWKRALHRAHCFCREVRDLWPTEVTRELAWPPPFPTSGRTNADRLYGGVCGSSGALFYCTRFYSLRSADD